MYAWSDDIQSGYVDDPDSFGSMFGILVLSSGWGAAVVVRVGFLALVLEKPSPASDPTNIYIERG